MLMPDDFAHGVVDHPDGIRKTDYLYRISIKGLVRNQAGEVLFVKEAGRSWWDLPGGGMDHGESIKEALAREMKEEVNLTGNFSYRIIHVDEPSYLPDSKVIQVRLIFMIKPERMEFSPGEDADEVAFLPITTFKDTDAAKYRYLQQLLENI